MIARHLLFVVILFGAAVIPYLANNSSGVAKWLTNKVSSASGEGDKMPDILDTFDNKRSPLVAPAHRAAPFQQPNHRAAGVPPGASQQRRIESEPVADLAEAIRFDVPPSWVTSRWPRVDTNLLSEDPPLQGYRVALVTGTRPDDIAGSLTYYFTPAQHVRRLTFRGTTGDPRRLVELVTKKYELKLQPPTQPGETIYQVRRWGQSYSELKIVSEGGFRPDSLHNRYAVTMEINNFAAK